MVSDVDIWHIANLLIKHGAAADLEAARQQELMLRRGNYDGPTRTAIPFRPR